MVGAILVVLVVGLVVLVVVRDQVAQRETVVGGDEIHRAIRTSATLVEQFAGSGHAPGEVGELAFVAFPEGTHGIAEAVVPLHPTGGEATDLIATGTTVPGFGDQFYLAQDRVLAAGDEEAVALVEPFVIPAQDGRQVEAKAVDVHLAGPIPQGVGDHLQYAGMAQVEGVAGARIVDVEALVLRVQAVVGDVVDAAHRQGGALLVAFGGVVVDHVQNHLQASIVQVRNHFLELGDLAVGQVARVRGEESDAVVAPVIVQAFLQQVLVVDEGMDRQQFDGGDAELADVLKHVLDHQPGKGATHILGHRGVHHADAAHMGLVDDGAVPRDVDALVAAPGIGRVDDLALGHERRAVAFVEA
ncbi:hypothetical protein D3C76_774730 [compost metagenome]